MPLNQCIRLPRWFYKTALQISSLILPTYLLSMTIAEESPTDSRKPLLPPLPPQAAGAGRPSSSNKLLMRRRGFQVPSALDIEPAAAAAAAAAAASAGSCSPLFSKDAKEYTSLRDIMGWCSMPAGLPSPTTPGGACGPGEVRIRNRLVQQAAQAYLQPTPSVTSHRRRGALPDCGDLLSRGLRLLGGVCRSVCRSLCPFRWHAIYIVDTKC